MRKYFILIVFFGFLAKAHAQSSLGGFYFQMAGRYDLLSTYSKGIELEIAGTSFIPNITFDQIKELNATLATGFQFVASEKLLLGLGVEYSPNGRKQEFVTINFPGAGSEVFYYKKLDSFQAFISVASVLDQNSSAYFKLGYGDTVMQYFDEDFDLSNNQINFPTYSFGLGYKRFVMNGLYGFAEASYSRSLDTKYTNSGSWNSQPAKISIKSALDSKSLMIGLGYQI
jgi:hypothetical protein